MRRVRFQIAYSESDLKRMDEEENFVPDTRPVIYPTTYPAWCSGSSFTHDAWVAYAPDEGTEEYIKKYWPEFDGQFDFNDYREKIEDSGRFPIDYTVYDENGIVKKEIETQYSIKTTISNQWKNSV